MSIQSCFFVFASARPTTAQCPSLQITLCLHSCSSMMWRVSKLLRVCFADKGDVLEGWTGLCRAEAAPGMGAAPGPWGWCS